MFDPKDPNKNCVRGMSTETYLDEMPLNWLQFMVKTSIFYTVGKRSASVNNKWFKYNRYPEE